MAHKVGRKIKKGVQGFLDDVRGKVQPGDVQYTEWQNQEYNPDWNTAGQTYNASLLGPAQGYTGQGYTGQGYTGQGYNASQLGSAQVYGAQGYTGQGYDASQLGAAQGYDATGYDATTGTYQAGQQFQDVLSQAMGASRDFMDPTSDWAMGQQAIASEQAGQLAGQTQAQQSAQLAARGMGGGGLRNILGSQAQSTAGAQLRQGATDIATAGAGLGLQAMGQAGQMATAQEQNILQQSLANQAAQNQASQFGAAAQNQAAQFGAGQQNQFSLANQAAANQAAQFGASAANTANQWSAGQQNQAAQFGAGQQNQFSLANQAAANQAAQFGAGAANMANQWSAGQANQAAQFTAGAQNMANQWSAGQQNQYGLANQSSLNAAGQFNASQLQNQNQFNTGNQMNWAGWNAAQDFASRQFNTSQANAVHMGNVGNTAGAIGGGIGTAIGAAKLFAMCIPEGTKIDTPKGSIKIEDLRAGDIVNGYGEKPVAIMQKHEYRENPESKRFLKIYFDNGDTIDLCDMHKIKDKLSQEYEVGDLINGKEIVSIKWYKDVIRSYDLLTEDKGYRISGIPVNSMVEEMIGLISLLKEVK